MPADAHGWRPIAEAPKGPTYDPAEDVISAAVLVAAAFRMRDEPGLVATLRQLGQAVDALAALGLPEPPEVADA